MLNWDASTVQYAESASLMVLFSRVEWREGAGNCLVATKKIRAG